VDGEAAVQEMQRVYSTATSSNAAERRDDSALREYTLVLMDLNMPKLNGCQVYLSTNSPHFSCTR
jgi:CheY-like chemotaxis protein